jgi:hypothetical protein
MPSSIMFSIYSPKYDIQTFILWAMGNYGRIIVT